MHRCTWHGTTVFVKGSIAENSALTCAFAANHGRRERIRVLILMSAEGIKTQ
jgi:hypothetical protein